ncbi:uncharacterized protein LOC129951950 [Eupeodes corollae]|uniref:uncharacterized protein LOC129951950 n=1 Tax=Eupeodes corollae TaxID=290404 RepID=UPI002491BE6E|nr:uncharacterized protein LOC129951950 [Eupeodes corollae]
MTGNGNGSGSTTTVTTTTTTAPTVTPAGSGIVNAISIKLPEFWKKMPAIWFIQVESQFSTRNIFTEQTKFHYVVQALPQDVAASVYDILVQSSNSPYTDLKKALIDRHSMSESKRIEQLLSGEEMGDKKPSEFYRRLQTLAGQSMIVTQSLILELWRRRLPTLVQASIKSSSETKLDVLLNMADEIYDVYQQQSSSFNIPSHNDTTIISALHGIVEDKHLRSIFSEIDPTPGKIATFVGFTIETTVINAANDSNMTNFQSRIFIKDPLSKLTFLIDSGADVSAIPSSMVKDEKRHKPDQIISAANGSQIKFTVPSTSKQHLVFERLIDPLTQSSVTGTLCNQNITSPRFFAIEEQYNSILRDFSSLMQPPDFTLPIKHSVVHHILTKGSLPSSQPRRLNNVKFKIAKEEFEYMVQIGICRPSSSPCASPLHMAAKHEANDWRPCGDYRRLNALTIPDRNPLPHIHDCNAHIQGCNIFSKVDLIRAYHNIPVAEDDIHKTAITTPFGLFEFLRMPFGLRNAAQTFQRFMSQVTKGLDFVWVFVDDILVSSKSSDDHEKHLRTLFQRLEEYGLRIKTSKCIFGASKLQFLGFDISKEGIQPSQSRVEAITNFPEPTSIKSAQRFVGMVNYYHRFIPHLARILAPIYNHLSSLEKDKKRKFTWPAECQEVFSKAKSELAKVTLLNHPRENAKLSITTDASNTDIGAVLQQQNGEAWSP